MNRNTLVEFAASISEDDLYFLNARLSERFQGDVAEALEFMSNFKALDAMFSEAKSAEEVFDLCDGVTEVLQKECKKRGYSGDRK